MPLQELVPGSNPARDDVQQTTFGYDVVPRYICNNWQEITAAQGAGSYPFDVVVLGAGMYGCYIAERLYRRGGSAALRILVLEAGAFLLQSHIQICRNSSAARSAAPIIRVRATMHRAHKMSSGACHGSVIRLSLALLTVSEAVPCSGAAGRRP